MWAEEQAGKVQVLQSAAPSHAQRHGAVQGRIQRSDKTVSDGCDYGLSSLAAVHLPRTAKEGPAHGKGHSASDSRKDHGHARKQRSGARPIHAQCAGAVARKARACDDVATQSAQLTNTETQTIAMCTVYYVLEMSFLSASHSNTSLHMMLSHEKK